MMGQQQKQRLISALLLGSSCLVGCALGQVSTDGVGVVIGGYGGGSSIEVVTATDACVSTSSIPNIPNAPAGQIEGWCSEYVDGQFWLCGGADLNFHSECYSIAPGGSYWVVVRRASKQAAAIQ